MECYKVSVAVLTYNPNREKLLATLRSVLLQKNIRFQIVIADDGSANTGFSASEALFTDQGFEDYVFVRNPENRGTVYNVLSAIEACSGTYVKLISPGDLLGGETVLQEWTAQLESSKAMLSFCDTIYYTKESGGFRLVVEKAHPQLVSCYRNKDAEEARFQYLIQNDLFLGAATLCRRDMMLRYISEIAGKVVYAEDNAYRLMAYDKVPAYYFPCNAVVYETGTGVSTSGSDIWSQRLARDWNACTQLLLERGTGKDPIDRALRCVERGRGATRVMKLGRLLRSKQARMYWLSQKKATRTTEGALPKAFLQKVFEVKQDGE